MSFDVNKAIVCGRLGTAPEVRYSGNGTAFAKLSVATTHKWKDRQSGQLQEATDWHDVVCSGKMAENAGQYLVQGQEVYVEGRMTKRKYQDNNGTDRYAFEIRATDIRYGAKPRGAGQGGGNNQGAAPQGGGNNGGYNNGPRGNGYQGQPQGGNAPQGGAGGPSAYDSFDDDIP